MTVEQLARYLGVSPATVRENLKDLGIVVHRIENPEIPVGGYELAVAAAIIKKQHERFFNSIVD